MAAMPDVCVGTVRLRWRAAPHEGVEIISKSFAAEIFEQDINHTQARSLATPSVYLQRPSRTRQEAALDRAIDTLSKIAHNRYLDAAAEALMAQQLAEQALTDVNTLCR